MKKLLIVFLILCAATSLFAFEYSSSSGLPNQVGQSGKVLSTDGANTLWQTAAGSGDLLSAQNLADVADAATSATNLGLGTASNVKFATVSANGTISANIFYGIGSSLSGLFVTANADLLYMPIGTAVGIVTANADARYVSNNQTTNVVLNGSVEITQGTITANEIVATGGITLGGVRNTAWPASSGGAVSLNQIYQFSASDMDFISTPVSGSALEIASGNLTQIVAAMDDTVTEGRQVSVYVPDGATTVTFNLYGQIKSGSDASDVVIMFHSREVTINGTVAWTNNQFTWDIVFPWNINTNKHTVAYTLAQLGWVAGGDNQLIIARYPGAAADASVGDFYLYKATVEMKY